jgi:putative membrane protein
VSELADNIPQRTAPLGVVIGALGSLQNAIFPAFAAAFGTGIGGEGLWVGLMVGLAAVLIGIAQRWICWKRTTYVIGESDIRVESGVLSRTARSVPFERIQDVSIEAKPLARLLGLVAVKFETGAGGADDLALSYLTNAEGERLRRLVRERRDEEAVTGAGAAPAPDADEAILFRMDRARLVTFGLFEFSLAAFAVLGGMLQYVDNFTSIDVWDFDLWRRWLSEQGTLVASFGPYAQAAGIAAGFAGLVLIGLVTGVVRTFLRDWGFTLTRSPRGFRRQRGLLTRTDVVMPVHRVQGVEIDTGVVRRRFGWHTLRFVSLAQDSESGSHDVAPFARMEEIAPVVAAAGFRLPDDATHWHRASRRYCTDKAVLDSAIFAAAAIPTAILAPAGLFLIPLCLAVLMIGANLFAWQFRRHAIDSAQVYVSHGLLSPVLGIAKRLKLHSVEIAQGPLARARGYATVHLGLAGGSFAMHGVPLAEALALRAAVLETITATDFSRLDVLPPSAGPQALSAAQSGFSANFLAT